MRHEDDSLEDLLRDANDAVSVEDEVLKERTFSATLSVLDRRRRIRRVVQGGVFVVIFALGYAVSNALNAPRIEVPREVPLEELAEEDAHALEVNAEVSDGDRRARFYRLAGDAWLRRHDTVAATRCYRRHLEITGVALVADPSETWLLSALRRTLDD